MTRVNIRCHAKCSMAGTKARVKASRVLEGRIFPANSPTASKFQGGVAHTISCKPLPASAKSNETAGLSVGVHASGVQVEEHKKWHLCLLSQGLTRSGVKQVRFWEILVTKGRILSPRHINQAAGSRPGLTERNDDW